MGKLMRTGSGRPAAHQLATRQDTTLGVGALYTLGHRTHWQAPPAAAQWDRFALSRLLSLQAAARFTAAGIGEIVPMNRRR